MSKGGSSSPAPIDIGASIQKQAEANRVNTFSPWGTTTFSGPNKSDMTISLSPRGEETNAFRESMMRALSQRGAGAVSALPQSPMDFGDLPAMATGVDMSGLNGDELEQATFKRGMNLIQPQFDRKRSMTAADLESRGIPIGSEAYNDAYQRISEEENPLMENLALSSVGAGRQEQSRMFDLGARNVDMGMNARRQGVNEKTMLRRQPFEDMQFYMTGQAPQMPPGAGPGQIDVTGPIQANYQGQLTASQLANQNRNQMLSGLFSLGAAALI